MILGQGGRAETLMTPFRVILDMILLNFIISFNLETNMAIFRGSNLKFIGSRTLMNILNYQKPTKMHQSSDWSVVKQGITGFNRTATIVSPQTQSLFFSNRMFLREMNGWKDRYMLSPEPIC